MKNITLNVDESTLEVVRRYAAEHNTSVNALVRSFLTELASREDRAARARQRLKELSEQSAGRVGSTGWTRDELHER